MNAYAPAAARRAARAAILLLGVLSGSAGQAEVGARLSAASDEIFRGRSISQGRPSFGLDLSYDDAGGFYLGGQAKGVAARGAGAQWLSLTEYGGYAWRTGRDLTIDLGITDTHYSRYSSLGRVAGYSEVTLGLIGRHLSGRLSLSPNWFGAGLTTGYAEAGATLGDPTGWQASLHGGVLQWLDGERPAGIPRTRYDWRIGLARDFGRVRAEAAWAAGGPRPDYYDGNPRGHGALVLSASARF